MSIHHTQHKKADRIGFVLTEDGDEETYLIKATNTKLGIVIYSTSAAWAINQAEAAAAIHEAGYRILADADDKVKVRVYDRDGNHTEPNTPVVLLNQLRAEGLSWTQEPGDGDDAGEEEETEAAASEETVERSEKGVALNGAIAYREKTPAADNPFSIEEDEEEYARAAEWDRQWDEAADAAEEDKQDRGGSVVSDRYRAKYAEDGHPTHCGDWLADTLNSACLTKKGIDIDRFEAICAENGVDTSKYNRDTRGWQGRLRMTGRNLLAKKVYINNGSLFIPSADKEAGGSVEHKAPAEWMAAQRYKMPVKQQ